MNPSVSADVVPGFPSRRMAELRGRVGGLGRTRSPSDPDLVAARRELYVLTLALRIERAGPYTVEERRMLNAAVYEGKKD